jgi:hypothetical protein
VICDGKERDQMRHRSSGLGKQSGAPAVCP